MQFRLALAGNKPLREYRKLGQLAEDLRFPRVAVYHDLMFKPSWPILYSIAEHTEKIQLGPSAVNPYLEHPALIAEQALMLDEWSQGRAFLGIGRGAFLEWLGIDAERPVGTVREAIQLVRRLIQGGRSIFEGDEFRASAQAFLRWEPVRRDLPIALGTWGAEMSRMGGAVADEVKVSPIWDSGFVGRRWKDVRAGLKESGRASHAVGITVGVLTSVADRQTEAEELARRSLAPYLSQLATVARRLGVEAEELDRVRASLERGDQDAAIRTISRKTLESFALFGTPTVVVEKIEEFIEAAPFVTAIEFGTPHGATDETGISSLGRDVIPEFDHLTK